MPVTSLSQHQIYAQNIYEFKFLDDRPSNIMSKDEMISQCGKCTDFSDIAGRANNILKTFEHFNKHNFHNGLFGVGARNYTRSAVLLLMFSYTKIYGSVPKSNNDLIAFYSTLELQSNVAMHKRTGIRNLRDNYFKEYKPQLDKLIVGQAVDPKYNFYGEEHHLTSIFNTFDVKFKVQQNELLENFMERLNTEVFKSLPSSSVAYNRIDVNRLDHMLLAQNQSAKDKLILQVHTKEYRDAIIQAFANCGMEHCQLEAYSIQNVRNEKFCIELKLGTDKLSALNEFKAHQDNVINNLLKSELVQINQPRKEAAIKVVQELKVEKPKDRDLVLKDLIMDTQQAPSQDKTNLYKSACNFILDPGRLDTINHTGPALSKIIDNLKIINGYEKDTVNFNNNKHVILLLLQSVYSSIITHEHAMRCFRIAFGGVPPYNQELINLKKLIDTLAPNWSNSSITQTKPLDPIYTHSHRTLAQDFHEKISNVALSGYGGNRYNNSLNMIFDFLKLCIANLDKYSSKELEDCVVSATNIKNKGYFTIDADETLIAKVTTLCNQITDHIEHTRANIIEKNLNVMLRKESAGFSKQLFDTIIPQDKLNKLSKLELLTVTTTLNSQLNNQPAYIFKKLDFISKNKQNFDENQLVQELKLNLSQFQQKNKTNDILDEIINFLTTVQNTLDRYSPQQLKTFIEYTEQHINGLNYNRGYERTKRVVKDAQSLCKEIALHTENLLAAKLRKALYSTALNRDEHSINSSQFFALVPPQNLNNLSQSELITIINFQRKFL